MVTSLPTDLTPPPDTEDIPVPESTVEKAREENINIISTPMSTYEACWKLHELLEQAET